MRTTITLVLVLLSAAAYADSHAKTLERVAETGVFRIGYVPDAPPVAFEDDDGNAVGYAIDLCRHIASAVQRELGLDSIDVEYTPLISIESRLSAVENGDIDIECSPTTVTLSRRERVDFTLMTFITGTALLSRRTSPINGIDDIADAKVAVLKGTTTEDVIRRAVEVNEFDTELVPTASHDEGMQLLNENEVDGYAADRSTLIGQVFRNQNARNQYAMTRTPLSFEPFAMMVPRGDTEFRLVADKALASLYRSARIRRIYHEWFGRYGEPLSPIVEAMYQFQAVVE